MSKAKEKIYVLRDDWNKDKEEAYLMGEICSYLQVPIKRPAAAFCTICKWATEGDLEQPKLYTRSKRDENTNFRFKVGAVQAAHFWIIRFHLCFLFWVRLCCICRWWEISRSLTLFFHTHCVPLKKHSRSRNICCSLGKHWIKTQSPEPNTNIQP